VTALLSAELLKLRTTRMVYGLLGALLAIVAVATIVAVAASSKGELERDPEGLFASPLSGIVFVLILGVMLLAGEFRHGTITQTLLATPVRWKVLVAKLVAAAILGFAFAVLAELLALALGVPAFALKGADFTFNHEAAELVACNIGAMTIAATLGVALGAVIRNQVAAIVVVFGWLLILEPLLGAGLEENAKYLPGAAIAAIVGADGEDLLSTGGGVAVTLAYVGVLAAIGGRFVFTRDVNSIQA
jgi:ABC-2 type transport system permease protein